MRFLINSTKPGTSQSAALVVQLAYTRFQNRLAARNNPLASVASTQASPRRASIAGKALSVGSILMETQSFVKKHEAAGVRRPKREQPPAKPKMTSSVLFAAGEAPGPDETLLESLEPNADRTGRASRVSFDAAPPRGGGEAPTLGTLQRVESLLLQLLEQHAPRVGAPRASVLQQAGELRATGAARDAPPHDGDALAAQVVSAAVTAGTNLADAAASVNGAMNQDDMFTA